MRILLTLTLLAALLSSFQPSFAQVDSVEMKATPAGYGATKIAPAFKLKPRLGLGVGSLMFYGDLGRENRAYHPGSADMAYTLTLTNEVTSFLDVTLYTLFGTLNLNEHTPERIMNLQSQIRSGGALVTYNFDHFLPSDRGADPFIGIGFESFEFLSKTDLYDANGFRYHYWSDGTIRNLSESDPEAASAILLERDYVYETDLREMNLDGRGAYPERSFAVPITAGVQFRVTDRFRAQLGARYLFTFTDLVDNMTGESAGPRQGNGRNDRFLYTHCTVNYDLNPLKLKRKRTDDPFDGLDDEELMAALEDTDGDGVVDLLDRCKGTPPGVAVDQHGCPIDSDGDGIPDYRDDEPHSPHHYVDGFGVAMDDEAIYERFLMWQDSIPWKSARQLNEDHARIDSDMSRAKEVFRVRINRNSEGMTQVAINTLLAQHDVTSQIDGSQEMILIGEYEQLPDAVKRKVELSRNGITAAVVSRQNEEDDYAEVAPQPELEAAFMSELNDAETADDHIHFRVQVGAFRGQLSANIFADVGDVLAVRGDDGLIRYVTSSFDDVNTATRRKTDLFLKGFKDAFITAYRGGVRITLAEAGMQVRDQSKDLIVDRETRVVDESLVKFVVIFGDYTGDIPADQIDRMLDLGGVQPKRQAGGNTLFMSEPMDDLDKANDLRDKAEIKGITAPKVSGLFNGKAIPIDDAIKLKKVGPRQVLQQSTN